MCLPKERGRNKCTRLFRFLLPHIGAKPTSAAVKDGIYIMPTPNKL